MNLMLVSVLEMLASAPTIKPGGDGPTNILSAKLI
jgi:hypothetical protein